MTVFLAGCLLGISGAAHCTAMCGPLVVALQPSDAQRRRTTAIAAYHVGRILVYVVLSLPAGAVAHTAAVAGLGRAVGVIVGIVLLVMAAGIPSPAWVRRAERVWCRLLSRARPMPARPAARAVWGPLRAGAVNGLLPCGLVYPAALTATALGDPASTLLFMLGFGSGTLPAMVGLSYGAALFPSSQRPVFRRLTPAALMLTGALLILQALPTFEHGLTHQPGQSHATR